MRELLNALCRYLICNPAGKINVFKELADIQLRVLRILIEFFKENLIIVQTFSTSVPKQKESQPYQIFDKFSFSRKTERPSLDCRAVQCYSILKTVPAILASPADILRGASSTPKNVCGGGYRDSRLENAQARRICALQDQPFLEYIIAWHLRTNVQCFREVSMIIFLDILDN